MTSRELSINTSLVNPTSLNGGLPSPTPSENSLMTATTTTTPLSSHTSTFLDIPSSFASFSFGQRPHVSGTLIRQRSFSGTDDDEAAALYAAVSRRPSLPVTSNSIHHHPMERHPSYDPRRQPGYIGHHPFLQQQQQEYERTMQRPLTPITPSSTPSPGSLPFANNTSSVQDNTTTTTNVIGSDIRHPLWKLECRVCTKVLCEQAMQGHLLGDPSQRLFSTNLAIG
ncbi:hypothetical protein BGZ46_002027 [Entomortierella lignicola]|nr:hypothetical protein BGZ46_002027 [Entomortierella lignicola]